MLPDDLTDIKEVSIDSEVFTSLAQSRLCQSLKKIQPVTNLFFPSGYEENTNLQVIKFVALITTFTPVYIFSESLLSPYSTEGSA